MSVQLTLLSPTCSKVFGTGRGEREALFLVYKNQNGNKTELSREKKGKGEI